MKEYYAKIGPSAREAYAVDSQEQLQARIQKLRGIIASIDYAKAAAMINEVKSLAFASDISHKIFLILPGETRSMLRVNFVSGYLLGLFHNTFCTAHLPFVTVTFWHYYPPITQSFIPRNSPLPIRAQHPPYLFYSTSQ